MTGAQARGEVVLILAVGIYLVLLIRAAWQADDACTAWRLGMTAPDLEYRSDTRILLLGEQCGLRGPLSIMQQCTPI